jgi:ABC-type branched-subunit amino acid transport system ATPase component
MARELVIEARGLRKSYGATVAVDGLDLEMAQGEVLSLLGPNGAGKTTTVEIFEGIAGATPAKPASWAAARFFLVYATTEGNTRGSTGT